jgi:glutathione S-transferase
VVAEQAAVYMYLADAFPQAGLAPAIGEPLRGPYLRWMVFYGSCFEPAIIDRSMKREPAPSSTSPYGSWDSVMDTLAAQLEAGPWLLGAKYTAADTLWGGALSWTMMFKLVPELPVFKAYAERCNARPAAVRARDKDSALLAELGARK